MPKTGTTALQKFLLRNSSKLEKYGWSYPILNDSDVGEAELLDIETCGNGYDMLENGILNGMKLEWDRRMEVALKCLENKNVIISAERIYEFETEFLEAIKIKHENIKVIVYLRRQDRAIESIYNQKVKIGDENQLFKDFIDSDAIPGNYLDYISKLDSICKIIGVGNLIVRIYEKQQLVGNDTITDFLSILGIPIGEDEWEQGQSENQFIGGNYLEICRVFNPIHQNINSDLENSSWREKWNEHSRQADIRNVCIKLSHAYGQDKDKRGFFTLNERKRFLEKYASCNEQVARKYLHREDGILFYDRIMDYPMYEVGQSSEFEVDMLRVFAAMMYMQDQRVARLIEERTQKLEKKYKELKEKSNRFGARLLISEALRRAKKRKIIFFGAGNNCKKLFNMADNISDALVVDNDVKKKGIVFCDIQVKSVGDILNWQEYFVVVTCWESDEIEKQLCSYGLAREEDYILMREYEI